MRSLLTFLTLYRRHWLLLIFSILLTIITILANISLLSLSGWFLTGTIFAGNIGIYTFNYILPAASIRILAIIRIGCRYAERLISHNTTFRFLSNLRIFIFHKLFPLYPSSIIQYNQGDILNRLITDIKNLDHLYLRVISPIFSAFVINILLIIMLSTLNPQIRVILCITMICLLIILPVFFYRSGKSIAYNLTLLCSKYRTHLINIIQSQAELTIFGALPRFRKILANLELNWLKYQQQQFNLISLSESIMIFISGCTTTILIWIIADMVNGEHNSGTFITLLIFSILASFEIFNPIATAFQHLGQVVTSTDRLTELINQKPKIIFLASSTIINHQFEIKLQHVYFSYPQQLYPTLKNICITISNGEHIALVGKTGCGKSTLLQLLTRAWDVNSGKILINNQPINLYSEKSLRKLMAVVPQRTYIFSDTLRNNLLIAKNTASDNLLIEVLKQTGLDTLTQNQGLDSWIGEGGRQLSGGEQRRLGIARAILYNAPIILLDEPTEGLDIKTEKKILFKLQQHCCKKTLLIITHRLNGLEKMNQIYIMDNGKIIKKTTHKEFLLSKGRYFKYYKTSNSNI